MSAHTRKNVVALSPRPPLAPVERAFMDFESEICDLFRAAELVSVALEADQNGTVESGVTVLPIALDDLMKRAKELKQNWCARHKIAFPGIYANETDK
jgi:hypothetical protein